MLVFQLNWFYYLVTGTVAIIISWLFTGCRFGNNIERPSNPDTISGYYQTQPQTLQFCATHTTTKCNEVITNQIPQLISQVMSNPVALVMQDLSTGDAVLVAPKGDGSALPVIVTPKNTLELNRSTRSSVLWDDRDCTFKIYVIEAGALTKESTPITVGGGLPLSGRVQLDVQILTAFDAKCKASLDKMASCYQDKDTCGGSTDADNKSLQGSVQDLFNPYIEAKVMQVSDIPYISATGYEVLYK